VKRQEYPQAAIFPTAVCATTTWACARFDYFFIFHMKTYICVICGFVYDEAAGRPEDGIAPGTQWVDVPESWACPDCDVHKVDFEMVEI
jgi:rubredoxin